MYLTGKQNRYFADGHGDAGTLVRLVIDIIADESKQFVFDSDR